MRKHVIAGMFLAFVFVLTAAITIRFGLGTGATQASVSEAYPLPVKLGGGLTLASSLTTGTVHSVSVNPAEDFALEHVRVSHTTAASTGTLTVTLDANDGAGYDVVLTSNDMASDVDWLYQPTRPIYCESGDKIVVAWSPDTATTMGLTVVWGAR